MEDSGEDRINDGREALRIFGGVCKEGEREIVIVIVDHFTDDRRGTGKPIVVAVRTSSYTPLSIREKLFTGTHTLWA